MGCELPVTNVFPKRIIGLIPAVPDEILCTCEQVTVYLNNPFFMNKIFSLLLFFLSFTTLTEGKPLYCHNVLIIHSYHKEMQWVEEIHRGIEGVLLSALGNSVDLKVEYMDSKRYAEEEYYAALSEIWHYKYKANNRPDCIIVSDDNAFNLVLKLRNDLFTDIPIVFCGVNYYDRDRFSQLKNVTGVIEAYDLVGSLNLVRRLMPERKRLFIINDDTTTGKANKARLEEIAYDFLDDINFMYSGTQTVSVLQSVVENLSDETAILLMSFNRDAEGTILRYRDAVNAVHSKSTSPIFGVWSFYLGKGIIGGSLVNGEGQGETAAELCLQILKGKPARELPIITESPNVPMFDYEELRRFSIPLNRLPEESVVINMPDTLWQKYKRSILAIAALVLAQSVIIAILIHNIRKRKHSEQRLASSQQNLSTTLAAIGEAVISVDTKGNVIKANPAAAELFAVPLAQFSKQNLFNLLVERDEKTGALLASIIEQSCLTGDMFHLPEKTVLKLPGERSKLLSGSCSAIRGGSSDIEGAVLICHDITEQENMRDMLAHGQKMEAIGQLAGGVAHDFNNLLTGISGFAELLSIQLEGDERKKQSALKIINAASRAKALTRQLLSFARKGKIVSTIVDCHEAITSTVALLERSIDKQINIVMELNAEQSAVLGDPVQLENIFLNLGINGADAIEGSGTITFATDNFHLEEMESCDLGEPLQPGKYIRISVQDSGVGIDEEVRHQIFEPFFTTKDAGKGTGLGLTAVFGAMKEHSGRIRLRSEAGQGSDFQLFFPLAGERVVKNESEQRLRKGNETILVIDDEPLVLASAKALLEELGYNVLIAEGCWNGTECFKEHCEHIDLVLLDMIMPDKDGAACFVELKTIREDVRVIICSGYSRTARIKEVEKHGAAGFLQKPYSAYEVSRTLRRVLGEAHI